LDAGGGPLAVVLAARLRPHVSGVWLVAKRDSGLEDLGLPLLYDEVGERALVHGIRTAIAGPGPAWRFVLGCDMPAVDWRVLAELWRAAHAAGAPGAAPWLPERDEPEPLPTLWAHAPASRIGAGQGLAARDWVRGARLARWSVPEAERWRFAHVNTVEEWEAWLRENDRRSRGQDG
jgi:molybdopterin-guanine dinucleotide biosynthesis protein A